MSGLDIEGVLSAHSYRGLVRYHFVCECQKVMGDRFETPAEELPERHRAHVAAVLREQIDGALVGERERIAKAIEVQQFATGLNWKARDALSVAASIARRPSDTSVPQ